MTKQESPEAVFGYLTTIESPEHGFFGGYLMVSAFGRPLEFHCTAPVRPNRAQQILYGPTLQPYLLGEQIGGTLLAQAKLRPLLVLTDQAAMLCLRSQMKMPIVCSQSTEGQFVADSEDTLSLIETDAASEMRVGHPESKTRRIVVAESEWWLPPGFEAEYNAVRELLAHLAKRVELSEPFERIHEAIHEAQRIGGRGQDAYGQAA
jgi:hypothetical protein